MAGPVFVTVHVDTREAEKRLRLLRWCLWLNALPLRIRRWLSDLVPVSGRRHRQTLAERDEARAVAGVFHQAYWGLLAQKHLAELSGKN